MSGPLKSISRFVVERATEESVRIPGSSNGPTVLSCGGLYLPKPKLNSNLKVTYQILNLANEREPTKVLSNQRPVNVLQQVLAKESLN